MGQGGEEKPIQLSFTTDIMDLYFSFQSDMFRGLTFMNACNLMQIQIKRGSSEYKRGFMRGGPWLRCVSLTLVVLFWPTTMSGSITWSCRGLLPHAALSLRRWHLPFLARAALRPLPPLHLVQLASEDGDLLGLLHQLRLLLAQAALEDLGDLAHGGGQQGVHDGGQLSVEGAPDRLHRPQFHRWSSDANDRVPALFTSAPGLRRQPPGDDVAAAECSSALAPKSCHQMLPCWEATTYLRFTSAIVFHLTSNLLLAQHLIVSISIKLYLLYFAG